MRLIAKRQLAALGYRVIEADRATSALELLATERIDLLFSDIVMPGEMSGFELARIATAQWPGLKAVLTSGFPEARLRVATDAVAGVRLLSKPYRREELARILRESLDAPFPTADDPG
jgi:CheY-like chemotaxis protein